MSEFQKALESLINRFSQENGSNTPDFILAEYLQACLIAFDRGVRVRETWYGRNPNTGPAGMVNPPSPKPHVHAADGDCDCYYKKPHSLGDK